MEFKLFSQLFRFAAIGTLAASVNYLVVIFLVEEFHFIPLTANAIAFLVAVWVSFFGHHHWTFANNTVSNRVALRRFFLTASLGFILTEGSFALLLKFTGLAYQIALGIVIVIIPALTFILSRLWAFHGDAV